MNEMIKQKAQELYPIESKAECHVAFLQGAEMIEKSIMLGLAEVIASSSNSEKTKIHYALSILQNAFETYKENNK